MNIYISLGHNNARNIRNILTRDQGAVAGGHTEFGITKEVARLLPSRYKGKHTLVFVPEKLSLVDRCKWINARAKQSDRAIELHMNAGGGTGVEVFYEAGKAWEQVESNKMTNSLANGLNLRNRGNKPDTATRFGRLGFCRDVSISALLIELGFIDNDYDRGQVINYGSSALAKMLLDVYG